MTYKKLLPLFLIFSLLFFACKKEEELTKEKELAANQQTGINFLNQGGTPNLGGGTTSFEYIEGTFDGVKRRFDTVQYAIDGLSTLFSGATTNQLMSFVLRSIPSSGDTIDFSDPFEGSATYSPGLGQFFGTFEGLFIVDSSTTTYLSGTFDFRSSNRKAHSVNFGTRICPSEIG